MNARWGSAPARRRQGTARVCWRSPAGRSASMQQVSPRVSAATIWRLAWSGSARLMTLMPWCRAAARTSAGDARILVVEHHQVEARCRRKARKRPLSSQLPNGRRASGSRADRGRGLQALLAQAAVGAGPGAGDQEAVAEQAGEAVEMPPGHHQAAQRPSPGRMRRQ